MSKRQFTIQLDCFALYVAFVVLLFVGPAAFAQTPDSATYCHVTGTLYKKVGDTPAANVRVKVVSVTLAGYPTTTADEYLPTTDANGAIDFYMRRGATACFYAPVNGLNRNATTGTCFTIPDATTGDWNALVPVTAPPSTVALPALSSANNNKYLKIVNGAITAATVSGGSGGSGTVEEFSAGNLSPLFSSSVSNPTTTPALSFSLTAQAANRIFAGPTTGSNAAPTFRALVAADIPALSISGITGLQTALDGKASTSHTHAQIDVTNLTTDLAAKANTADLAAVATSGSASDLGAGTLPLARLSGITTSQLSATAGITNGQLAGSIAISKLSITGTPNGSKYLRDDGSWQAISGGGDLLAANNLSDVASASTARTNLGIAIGTDVQAYSAVLGTYASINPSANVQSLLGAANYAAMRSQLGLATIATSGSASDLNGGTVPLARLSGITTSELSASAGITNGQLAGSITLSKLSITGTPDGSKFLRDDGSWQAIPGGGDALVANPLNQFAATTSSQLAGVISDETGTGVVVLANSPTLTTPALGVASVTSVNKVAITAPATSATLTIADGKTLTASNTLTLTGTDGSTLNVGGGGTLGTAAYTAASAYEVPLTFSTGLTRSTNTITVNTTQNIARLSNLTSNGFVKTSAGDGTLSVDTTAYVPTSTTVAGNALSTNITQDNITGLSSTGIIKRTGANTLTIAVSGTDYAPATSGSSILYANGSGGFSAVTVGSGLDFTGGTLTATGGGGGGSGDVVGPSSATDNAVVRFDTTTGKLIQNSVVTIADTTGNVAGVGTLNTHTIPSGTDTFALITATQTLTNKTMTASSNVLGGVTMTLGSDANGDIYYRSGGVLTRLAKGTAGQVLTMNAGATAPEWATASGGGSSAWSALTAPSANLSLSMSTYTTTMSWATGTSTNNLFNLTTASSSNGTGYLLHVATGTSSDVKLARWQRRGNDAVVFNPENGNATQSYKFHVNPDFFASEQVVMGREGAVTASPYIYLNNAEDAKAYFYADYTNNWTGLTRLRAPGASANTLGTELRLLDSSWRIYVATGSANSTPIAGDSAGNVLFGGASAAGTSATGVLVIANGTAPSSSPANAFQLYSASGEGTVRDASGNITTISPHNLTSISKFNIQPSEQAVPWAYTSANVYAGKKTEIDMLTLAREVEKLSGKKIVYVEDLPSNEVRDWDEDEEARRAEREAERTAWAIRKAAREKAQADFDALLAADKAGKERPADFDEPRPRLYEKRPEPKYISDRKPKRIR